MIRNLVLLLLLPTLAFAQSVQDATKLVDAGKFDEGIEILKKVLAAEPGNQSTAYELGLAYSAKGDFAQCRTLLEPLAASAGTIQVQALSMLANCVDQLGQHDKAIELYRRGLAISPEDAQLNFNLAVTLVGKKSFDEARQLLERDTRANPWHASAHLLLARLFEAQGFRVPGVLSFMHFLALEPISPRSADAATRLMNLVTGGVKKTKGGGANITIDSNPRKEEGDYGGMEMMLAIVSAGTIAEDKKTTEFQKSQGTVGALLAIYLESKPEGDDYTATVQRPFFEAMEKEKLTDPFAGIAIASLRLPGTVEWSKANEKEITRYLEWVKPQTQPTTVQLPNK